MKEVWKDVVGYEGLYQVSNLGDIKSLDRGNKKGRVLKERIQNGYVKAVLCVSGKEKSLRVHRLVAQAFIPNRNGYPQINHKNGVKRDNRVENLEWCTHSMNVLHSYVLGLKTPVRGEKNKWSKLKDKDVIEIRKMIKKGVRQVDIAEKFKVDHTAISRIKLGKAWTHV